MPLSGVERERYRHEALFGLRDLAGVSQDFRLLALLSFLLPMEAVQEINFAIKNAAPAARAPIIRVCTAPRRGAEPVKRPLM